MTAALIMAGGCSERMRATAGPTHKALTSVLGVSMLERNLCMLLRHDVKKVVVAASRREPEISSYLAARGKQLACAFGAHLEVFLEAQPLGTIGAARQVGSDVQALLVVNVDNLTSLDLNEFLATHVKRRAIMTIATHVASFPIPFGEVCLDKNRITGYFEKPVRQVRVSSGTYVLSAEACRTIPEGRAVGVPELFALLSKRGAPVCAFPHQAPWIDVNDASDLTAAEKHIAEHSDEFECWNPRPMRRRVALLLESEEKVLVENPDTSAGGADRLFRIPCEELPALASRTPESAQIEKSNGDVDHRLRRPVTFHHFVNHLSAGSPCHTLTATQRFAEIVGTRLITFDDLDESSGKVIRHYVFHASANSTVLNTSLASNYKWVPLQTGQQFPMSSVLRRCLAWRRRSQ